ncbi:MAG TPA: phospholipase D family protein [Burkholderiaceae bacterium]|nr:phospholipase D family protein [Burkholderiaceae bacterium]
MRTLMRWLYCAVLMALAGCASLPPVVERQPSRAITDTADTRLARSLAASVAAHSGKTGVHPLASGREAFAARVAMTLAAERGIDVQYYIWHDDITGTMLTRALLAAADRNVRVRVLLDDNNTKGLDDTLAMLDAHRNVEVRLFNPFANRSNRLADYATDFSRLNRRMHNKSFTVDGQVTIVGGRNIGDEYFGASEEMEFADLDVIAVGKVVQEVSSQFDAYWNSASAYPARSITGPTSAEAESRVQAHWAQLSGEPRAARYVDALRDTPLVRELLANRLPLEWVTARLVFDDPAKVLHPPEQSETHMLPRLQAALGVPRTELDLVSPYFVPGDDGTQALRALADRGVQVRVLTNSLSATDVGPVYAGYSKYREPLLHGGNLRLFELKRTAPEESETADKQRRGIGSSSDAGLHAKTFAVDRQRIFVGSFNLDPRSARLNTEMGVVLDSAALASRLAALFDREIPQTQYEVRLAADGSGVEWAEHTPGGELVHRSSPETGVLRRAWIGLLSVLPIEWLL